MEIVLSIADSSIISFPPAILSHQEHSTYSFLQRKFELDERRHQYQWDKRPGLPGRILTKNYDSLPKEAKLNQVGHQLWQPLHFRIDL